MSEQAAGSRERGSMAGESPELGARNPPWRSAPGGQHSQPGFFGVEGIDALVPGGVSYDTQIMVQGDTGIGKSVLAAQFVYEGLLVGDRCVYVACDEPPSALRESMANLRLGTVAYERSGQLVFIDSYSRERSRETYFVPDPSNFDEFFLYQRRVLDQHAGVPTRMVVDSISTVLSTAATPDILEFSGLRLRYLRARRVLTLDVVVAGVIEERALAGLSHLYPMILKMHYVPVDGSLQRYLQLGKLRSGHFTSVQHQFSIDPRTGIIVHPARG